MKNKTDCKPKTKKELAELYGVNIKTFSQWLNKLGMNKSDGYLFNPSEIRNIFLQLGEP